MMTLLPTIAIVGDVAIAHDQAVIADRGDGAAAHRAAMQRGVLADDVVVADDKPRRFAFDRKILRRAAETDERKDSVVRAKFGVALDEDVCDQLGAFADLHIRADHTARADLDIAPSSALSSTTAVA